MAGVLTVVVSLAVLSVGCAAPVQPNPPVAPTGPSPGCGTTSRGGVVERSESVDVGRARRRYVITVPPQHRPGTTDPVPLVLDLHGLIEGMVGTHPFATQFSATAVAEGFAVVFPIGSNGGFNWDVSLSEGNPDLRYIDALLEHLGDTMCVDRSRVYVTGLSNGAALTSMLMCMRPNTFAAAAPVAGILAMCAPTGRRVPFVTFHGTADAILPYALFAATPRVMASRYGCDDSPVVETLHPDPDPVTRGSITRTTWDCTSAGSAAESYVIDRGGHSWPGSEFFGWVSGIVGPTATSLDATPVIWEFFRRHRLS
ncbi:MAG: PHB depolymerase family esterase [Microthrixaceae bacterium]